MRIRSIRIDGFGVWRDLELEDLSGQATVFYGPNEAGKTTLMQFVRSMLYGFSPARKQRYLPPLGGGRPGGALSVDTSAGRCEISRWNERGSAAVVTAPDGTQQGEPALAALLGGIDEAIFNNVYACGLREIQELGTLTDTEAARHLYDLTTGLDRVSLVDVQRELAASRERLLADEGRPSVIARLLSEQARLVSELDTARTGMARYLRLAAERTTLAADVAVAEQQHRMAEAELRLLDIAAAIRPKWVERIEVAAQLDAMPPVSNVPTGAVERLQRLHRRIKSLKRRAAADNQRCRQLSNEAEALSINEHLWRQGPRIEALNEQRAWIGSISQQAAAADAAATQLEVQVTTLRGRLGFPALPSPAELVRLPAASGTLPQTLWGSALPAPVTAPPRYKSLRGATRTLKAAQRRRREAKQAIEKAAADARTAERDIATRLSGVGESDLPSAMEKHGTLAGQLRRRMQLDERLSQMNRNQAELTEQGHQSLDRQLLPTNVLIGLGAAFVVGTLLVLVGLLMPSSIVGTLGWPLAILGLCGAGGGAGAKYLMQRAAARELENCKNQLSLLETQIKQAQEERDELDRRLPRGGGPLASRLKTTETSLAALEELLPLDAKRQVAQREVQAARTRADELVEPYRAARRGWRKALRAVGLPDTLTPAQARQMAATGSELAELEAGWQQQREIAAQCRRELAGCTQRAAQLAADAGIDAGGLDTAALIDRLASALAEQHALVRSRDELLDAARQARIAAKRRARRLVALKRRRRRWLRTAGATNPAEFRRLALAHARREVLVRQHATLSTEIAAASTGLAIADGGVADWEEQLARRLADPHAENFERNRQQLAARVTTVSTRLQQLYTDRGRLDEQISSLASDRGPAELTLDLSAVQQQLRSAVSQWQERAVCGLLLDEIRTQYERERQPATLKDASEHLNRLTSGTYPRVWTPLGERRLLVDDANGRPLSPEVLSEGTREQLFLSLRLALVARYAERGVRLPLVLDDVLVNFDADRAKSAVHVLRDFAKSGHQVLLFTCHDHIVKAFKAAKVETRALPMRSAGTEVFRAAPEPVVEEQEVAPAPRPVVAPPLVEKRAPAPIVITPVVMPPLVAPPIVELRPEPPARPRRAPRVKDAPEQNSPEENTQDEGEQEETIRRNRWRRKPIDEFARIEFGHVSPPLEDEELVEVTEEARRIVPQKKHEPAVRAQPEPVEPVYEATPEAKPDQAFESQVPVQRTPPAPAADDIDEEDLYGIIPTAPDDDGNDLFHAEVEDEEAFEDEEYAELDGEDEEEAEYDEDFEDYEDDESEAA